MQWILLFQKGLEDAAKRSKQLDVQNTNAETSFQPLTLSPKEVAEGHGNRQSDAKNAEQPPNDKNSCRLQMQVLHGRKKVVQCPRGRNGTETRKLDERRLRHTRAQKHTERSSD
tara:strand:- start:572 stop:913 length:342 start_codon:yes stop_codon:yes gene_type:complete